MNKESLDRWNKALSDRESHVKPHDNSADIVIFDPPRREVLWNGQVRLWFMGGKEYDRILFP